MQDSLDYILEEDLIENNENKISLNNVKLKDLDSTLLIEDKFDPKNQDDLNSIIDMGYDPKMAKKVYILLNPADINEAINFLTVENDIYQHDFVERHGKIDVCFICGESAQNHINYIPPESRRKSLLNSFKKSLGLRRHNSNLSNSRSNLSIGLLDNKDDNKSNSSKNNKHFFCDLCIEEMTEEEKKRNEIFCGHLFCSDCYLNYFMDKINNNKVGKIMCMQHKCTYELDKDFIVSHLNEDKTLINKYQKFKLRSDLYNDPNVKFCPIKDCESYAIKEGDNKYVTCLEGHKFCFTCLKEWHGKKKCQDEIDIDFKKWKKNKIVKQCPNCKMWTEKNLGCNHMTCAECKYQWCWLCGGKYTEGHYQMGGSCYGLQFSDSNLFNNCFCFFLFKIWIFLYNILIMVFIIPIFGFFNILKTLDYDIGNCCVYFLAFPIWFFACLSNLIIYLAIGSILYLISIPFYSIREAILNEMFEDE